MGPAPGCSGLSGQAPVGAGRGREGPGRDDVAGSVAESSAGQEWVGVAFRMGGETCLVAREETREVLGYPAVVTRIPGAKGWVKGLANIRGLLMPMLDLRQFLGSGATVARRNTRIVGVKPPGNT